MNAATIPPAPLTCARCGAEFGRDEAVAYLGERVVHARLDDCVAVFHRRITTLEAGNAELRERLEEALKYQSFWDAHFHGSNVVWPELVTVTTSASAIPWDTKWVRESNGRLRPHGPFIPNADTPPPPDDDEPVLDVQKIIDRLASVWGILGANEESLAVAADLIAAGMTRTAAARAELQQLIDELHAPTGQGD